MKRFKIPLLLLSVYLFIAIIIYSGVVFIPEIETKKTRLEQKNYFLGQQTDLISSPVEQAIARDCKSYITKLENNFRQELTNMGRTAYQEYQALKAEDPDTSPYSLAGKYMSKLRFLEEKYDSQFEDYINVMEQELKSESLSLKLVDHAKYAYRVKKRNIKQEFYQRGKQLLDKD